MNPQFADNSITREYPSWTIERKIAQLIFPRLNLSEWERDKQLYIDLVKMGVGGFCVFQADIHKMRAVVEELNQYSDIPLLYSCDMEFGLPMRFADGTAFPRAYAIGQTGNPGNAYISGKITALEAKSCGIFWNLSPVADINSNPDNPIINIRSFSDNPVEVSGFISAQIAAIQEERVIACAKHFPGHGDTDKDSHIEVPVLSKSLEELTANELVPFFVAIKQGVRSIMVGHLAVPALDDSNLPASLSRKITTDFLRNKLGYSGIIVTDALDMKSVENKYPNGEATYLALQAGADALLIPENAKAAFEYIKDNLVNIDNEQILNSFDRIIENKRRCGLLDGILNNLPTNISFEEHQDVAIRMATNCIQIFGEHDSIPLDEDDSYMLIGVLLDDRNLDNAFKFSQMLQSKTINDCDTIFVNNAITEADMKIIEEANQSNNTLIIAVFQSPSSYSTKAKIATQLLDKLNELSKFKKTILANFAPSNACEGINFDLKLDAMSDDANSMLAVANYISGNDETINYVSDIDVAKYHQSELEKAEEQGE